MGVVVLVLIVAVVGAAVYLGWQAKQKRREAMHQWAMAHGLSFPGLDPTLLDTDFHLFAEGDGRGCENVMAGTFQGLAVRVADYWYYTESRDGDGDRSKTYHRFSVAVAQLPGSVPAVRIEHEGVLSKLGAHLGLRDIELESERFNRRFRVLSHDRQFAFGLIDARMMEFLLSTDGDHCYEVTGPNLLVWVPRRKTADQLGALLYAAKAFVEHVPSLVWQDHGTAPT